MPNSTMSPLVASMLGPSNGVLPYQQQLQMGMGLSQEGMDSSPLRTPLGGLARLSKALLGAYMMNNANDQLKGYQDQMGALFGASAPGSTAGTVPASGGDALAMAPPRADPQSGQSLAALPNTDNAAQIGQPVVKLPQGGTPVQPGALSLPGVDPKAMRMLFALAPDEVVKAALSARGPTDIQKNLQAAGINPSSPEGQAILRGTAQKGALLAARPGAPIYDVGAGRFISTPNAQGFIDTQGSDGNWSRGEIPGAAETNQALAYALAAPKAALTPQAGFDQNGKPTFTNQFQAATGHPYAPGSTLPMPGSSTAAPGIDAGRFAGYAPPGMGGGVAPALPPGVTEAQTRVATGAADRANTLSASAADSPTRVNVLDNIINLSTGAAGQPGVETGPGSEFQNKILGYAANIPGLKDALAGSKDDVTKFQEIKKFLSQNAIRAWSAAGGTGTDAQQEAAFSANPNDAMFPQALQSMAKWSKAGELALQSKLQAQTKFLGQNTAADLPKFESAWVKNFDPRMFQMSLMSPAEMGNFAQGLSESDRAALSQKIQLAKQNGWMQ